MAKKSTNRSRNKSLVPALLGALLVMAIAATAATAFNPNASEDENRETILADVPTFEAAVEKIQEAVADSDDRYGGPHRFILFTNDGEHVMWGQYGSGYFAGEDNEGKKAWGIYKNGLFAGFHEDEFFTGKYYRGSWRGNVVLVWKAENLFGEEKSGGRLVLFPVQEPVPKPVPYFNERAKGHGTSAVKPMPYLLRTFDI